MKFLQLSYAHIWVEVVWVEDSVGESVDDSGDSGRNKHNAAVFETSESVGIHVPSGNCNAQL